MVLALAGRTSGEADPVVRTGTSAKRRGSAPGERRSLAWILGCGGRSFLFQGRPAPRFVHNRRRLEPRRDRRSSTRPQWCAVDFKRERPQGWRPQPAERWPYHYPYNQEWITLRLDPLGDGGRRPFVVVVWILRPGARHAGRIGCVGGGPESQGSNHGLGCSGRCQAPRQRSQWIRASGREIE